MLPRWSPSHAPGLDRKIYPCRASGEIYAQIDLKWKCRSSLCSRITGGTTTDRSSNTSPGAGLYVLCAAELCERLASTVALSLLVLYLNERLRFDEGRAARMASYVSVLSYLAGVLGGVLADRTLGARRAVLGPAPTCPWLLGNELRAKYSSCALGSSSAAHRWKRPIQAKHHRTSRCTVWAHRPKTRPCIQQLLLRRKYRRRPRTVHRSNKPSAIWLEHSV